jgi:hypothetical protein
VFSTAIDGDHQSCVIHRSILSIRQYGDYITMFFLRVHFSLWTVSIRDISRPIGKSVKWRRTWRCGRYPRLGERLRPRTSL